MSGVDVLKFMRSQVDLAQLPVVVLSNAYMSELAQQAAEIGAQKALLKASCSPSQLTGVIREILEGKPATEDTSLLAAAARPEPSAAPRVTPPSVPPVQPTPGFRAVQTPTAAKGPDEELAAKARVDLLGNAPAICADLRGFFQAFTKAEQETERGVRLHDLYRKVHFVAEGASLAGCHHLAQLSRIFEALLFEVTGKQGRLTPSVLRTMAQTIDFLDLLFERARGARPDEPLKARALAVDDDPLSNRLVVAALHHAQLQARSTGDPRQALEWMGEGRYDLILLDVEMPGMDGFEMCKQLRALPGYQKTPVIYVTSHSDFESRTKGILSGGDDFISKPVFPMELAVKAVVQLLKSKAAETAA